MAICWIVLVVACLRGGLGERLFSLALLRWLGLRSYGIYLIHWPLIELTEWSAAAVLLTTLALAELSYRLIELPVRERRRIARAGPVFATAVAAIALIAGVAAAASEPIREVGERRSDLTDVPDWFEEARGIQPAEDPGPESVGDGVAIQMPPPTTSQSAPTLVTVIGDSTAVHISDGLRRWGDETRLIRPGSRGDSFHWIPTMGWSACWAG